MFTKNLGNLFLAGGVLLALALVIGSAVPHKALAEDPVGSPRLISVTGEAELQVKPDMATISFGVETQSETAQAAQQANASKMSAVVNALSAKGIAKDDIQTSNFSLYPVYEWQGDKEGKQVLTGYRCNNSVVVRIKNIGNIGPIIDAATVAGANSIGGIRFGVLDPKPHQDALLAQAVKNARAKADIMAEAAGVNIVSVHKISDGYTNVSSIDEKEWRVMADAASSSTPVEPGSVTIRASVYVEYQF